MLWLWPVPGCLSGRAHRSGAALEHSGWGAAPARGRIRDRQARATHVGVAVIAVARFDTQHRHRENCGLCPAHSTAIDHRSLASGACRLSSAYPASFAVALTIIAGTRGWASTRWLTLPRSRLATVPDPGYPSR